MFGERMFTQKAKKKTLHFKLGLLASCLFNKPLWKQSRRGTKIVESRHRDGNRKMCTKLDLHSTTLEYRLSVWPSQHSWLGVPHIPADPNFTLKECESHNSVFSIQQSRCIKKGFICPTSKSFLFALSEHL